MIMIVLIVVGFAACRFRAPLLAKVLGQQKSRIDRQLNRRKRCLRASSASSLDRSSSNRAVARWARLDVPRQPLARRQHEVGPDPLTTNPIRNSPSPLTVSLSSDQIP